MTLGLTLIVSVLVNMILIGTVLFFWFSNIKHRDRLYESASMLIQLGISWFELMVLENNIKYKKETTFTIDFFKFVQRLEDNKILHIYDLANNEYLVYNTVLLLNTFNYQNIKRLCYTLINPKHIIH
jgi:hypothetical protein